MLTQYPGLLSRQGLALKPGLANNRFKTYVDTDQATAKKDPYSASWHLLAAYFPAAHYAVVLVRYQEGARYVLLDLKNGKELFVSGVPALSADKKRFAFAHLQQTGIPAPSELSVYLITPQGLTQEYALYPEDWGVTGLKWLTNAKIEFVRQKVSIDPDIAGANVSEIKILHYKGKDKWTMK